MRRLVLIPILLLISVLAIGSSTMAQSSSNSAQGRMVVFEALLRPG